MLRRSRGISDTFGVMKHFWNSFLSWLYIRTPLAISTALTGARIAVHSAVTLVLLSTAYCDVSTLNVGRRRRSACSLRPRDRLTKLGVWGGVVFYFIFLFYYYFCLVLFNFVLVWLLFGTGQFFSRLCLLDIVSPTSTETATEFQ